MKIGDKHHHLTIIGDLFLKKSKYHQESWVKCRCDCGKERDVCYSKLKIGHIKTCGRSCACHIKEQWIGQKFSKLLVIGHPFSKANQFRYVKCRCDCGKEVVVQCASLRIGNTQSCGCTRRKTTIASNGQKKCCRCGVLKPTTEFSTCNPKQSVDGFCPACVRCHKDTELQRTYNITIDDYESLLNKQNGCCAICGTNDPGAKPSNKKSHRNKLKFFFVDHDHNDVNIVRGLLCRQCNLGVGNFKDSPDLLLRAREYIEIRKNGLDLIVPRTASKPQKTYEVKNDSCR